MQPILAIILSIAGIFALLVAGNRRNGERYQQWWSPPAAVLLLLYVLYEYHSSRPEILDSLRQVGYLDYAELVVSLLAIILFALAKMGINAASGRFAAPPADNVVQSVPRFSIAYKLDKEKKVTLRKEWIFVRLYLDYFIWFALGVFLLTLMWAILRATTADLPPLPSMSALSLLIVLETYWYLYHPRLEQPDASPAAAVAPAQTPTDYYNLWEEYQRVWFDKLLLAWHYKSPAPELIAPANVQITEARNLLNAGYQLSVNDYHIIERLSAYDDLLIDDGMSDNVAPILFSVLLRRLMDGENILVLTAKRCYNNSAYHQRVVRWIDDCFYRLTANRDFWRVQLFSKTEDVQPLSRIIVTSADDILEKNITAHQWFSSLRTVLFLNGDEIFTESLAANNILLETLRDRYPNIQSVVLSDYREALQSSVARNLSVKSDLKEVRLRPAPPLKSFVLIWKLEGDTLFQHKVLAGHIEKHLGAEAVLALLARRERLTPIRMAGQEQLPYYEYLEELDNNQTALLTEPVAARTLKDKGVNEVQCDEAAFLMPIANEYVLFARDNDHNLPIAHRRWEAYSRQNVMVHLVCPPYLLRDYFIDNLEYFSRTPLYALSSKMMISRFETARSLLERLVNSELPESIILNQLHWINPKAVFVKQELSDLFRLAFGIDIIASNYLSIKTVYEFDKAEDSYQRITKYSLLPRIKDDVSLSFLRNVDVIDNARNVLKVIAADLLFQNYLPGQIHAFNGKSYSVMGYDRLNRKLSVNHRSPEPIIAYRPDLSLTLLRVDEPLTESHRKIIADELSLELCEGAFEVATHGYFSFQSDFSLAKNTYTYTTVGESEVPVREYQLGRMLTVTINVNDGALDIAKTTATLSVLMHEIFYTLFPETHQYLIVGSPINDTVIKGMYAKLYPNVRVKNAVPNLTERVIQLCILEDAFQDLGLVQSLFDKWDYLLRIADDYLTWLQTGTESNTTTPFATPTNEEQIFRRVKFDKSRFLSYGTPETPPDFLDLAGASALLRQLLGNNFLSSERKGFYRA